MARIIKKRKAELESFRLKREMQDQREEIHQLKQYIDVLKNFIKDKLDKEDIVIK